MNPRCRESLPGGCKGEARSGNAASNGFDRRESRKSSESQPSPPLSMASTDPLSEGVDDTAAWDQPPPSGEKGGGATAAARFVYLFPSFVGGLISRVLTP